MKAKLIILSLILISNVNCFGQNDSLKFNLVAAFNSFDSEFVGVITEDQHLLILGGGDFNHAYMKKPLFFNGKFYIRLEKNCAIKYSGKIENRLGTFIPIIATIHSHNPKCSGLGSLGIMSDEDFEIAKMFPSLRHFIIGCREYAEFNVKGYIKTSNEFNLL